MGEVMSSNRGSGRREKDIKVRDPDTFDGSDPSKLQDFLFQCQLHFRAKRDTYGTDEAKIYFTISFLRGATLGHFQPVIMGDLDNSDGESPDYVLVWAEFKEELYNNFGSTFPEEEAEEALKNLEMDPKWRAIKYFVLFGKYMSRTSWNDRAYTSRAYDGLPRCIKDRIAETNYL